MRDYYRLALAAALAVVWLQPVCAQSSATDSATSKGSSTDPKVAAILDKVAKTYRDLDALHVRIRVQVTTTEPAAVAGQWPDEVELWYQRPNKYRLAAVGYNASGRKWSTVTVCDGTTQWRWSSTKKSIYHADNAPSQSEITRTLAAWVPEAGLLGGSTSASLVSSDLRPYLKLKKPKASDTLDRDVITNDHLEKSATGPTPSEWEIGHTDCLVHGSRATGTMDYSGHSVKYEVQANYDLVDAKPTSTTADFQFVPPAGSRLSGTPKPPKAVRYPRSTVYVVPSRTVYVKPHVKRPKVKRYHPRRLKVYRPYP